MFTKNDKGYRLFILTGFLLMCIVAPAQKKLGLEPNEWANILTTAEFNEVNSIGSLTMQLVKTDSLKALRFLDSLESSNNAKGYVFRTYFNMVKADVLYLKFAGYDKYKDRGAKSLQPIKEQIMKLFAEALDDPQRAQPVHQHPHVHAAGDGRTEGIDQTPAGGIRVENVGA